MSKDWDEMTDEQKRRIIVGPPRYKVYGSTKYGVIAAEHEFWGVWNDELNGFLDERIIDEGGGTAHQQETALGLTCFAKLTDACFDGPLAVDARPDAAH